MNNFLFNNNYIDCWICNESNVIDIKKTIFMEYKNKSSSNILETNIFCTWNFWYNTNLKYENSLKRISNAISTIDQLKYWLQRISPIEQLSYNSNLYFFKSHITPRWEDRWNKNGARCIIPIYQTLLSDIPKYETWHHLLKIVLNHASENFIYIINGISFSKRKDNKDIVSIWINPYCDESHEEKYIIHFISEILCINPEVLQYKKHPI